MTRFTHVLLEPEPDPACPADELIQRDDSFAAGEMYAARLWVNHAAVVLPHWRLRDVTIGSIADGHGLRWPLCGRGSGGGAVAHGPGTLNLSLALPLRSFADPSVDDAYTLWIDMLAAALGSTYGIDVVASEVDMAFCNGRYDASVSGRKLAGTAQSRRSGRVVVHGTILVDVNAADYLDVIRRAEAAVGLPPQAHDPARIVSIAELVGRRVSTDEVAGLLALASRRDAA